MGAAILSIFESLGEQAVKAMEPDIAAAFEKLLPGTLKAAPTSGAEVAVATNLTKALPVASATELAIVEAKAGTACAEYLTMHPGADLQAEDVYADIFGLTSAGIIQQGLDVSRIYPNTMKFIVSGAIEMSVAGLGTPALDVSKPPEKADAT